MLVRTLILIAGLASVSGCATCSQVRVTTVESASPSEVATPSADAGTLRLRSANETEARRIIVAVLAVTSLVILVLASRRGSTP